MLGRGLSRYGLERYAEAEADLDHVLDEVSDPEVPEDQRRDAAYFRGLAREQQDKLSGALADYGLAIDLGYDGADVFQRRASVHLALGDVGAAREDVRRARELAPDDANTNAVDGEVLSAEGRFDEAVAAYDRALAQEQTADSEFGRALTLLVAGRPDEALAGYRRGVPIADGVDLERALAALERRAAGRPGAEACKKVLARTS
jgi:tetratricopeptide (TPR) repeat protein